MHFSPGRPVSKEFCIVCKLLQEQLQRCESKCVNIQTTLIQRCKYNSRGDPGHGSVGLQIYRTLEPSPLVSLVLPIFPTLKCLFTTLGGKLEYPKRTHKDHIKSLPFQRDSHPGCCCCPSANKMKCLLRFLFISICFNLLFLSVIICCKELLVLLNLEEKITIETC